MRKSVSKVTIYMIPNISVAVPGIIVPCGVVTSHPVFVNYKTNEFRVVSPHSKDGKSTGSYEIEGETVIPVTVSYYYDID